MVLPEAAGRQRLMQALGGDVVVTDLDLSRVGYLSQAQVDDADVAVLPARIDSSVGAVLAQVLRGLSEVIFVVDNPWCAERYALESCGVRNVASMEQLALWLPGALNGLCMLSRARRMTVRAVENAPARPQLPPPSDRPYLARLHGAESRFRETLLRVLLAEHGSRRKAAEVAGVPYRSFCEMLRRVGI